MYVKLAVLLSLRLFKSAHIPASIALDSREEQVREHTCPRFLTRLILAASSAWLHDKDGETDWQFLVQSNKKGQHHR
jgi:hypothetical protein